MAKLIKHKCIKCQAEYSDTDPDDYFCLMCREANKAIAREVDAKLAGRPRKEVKSELQQYDEIRKAKGMVNIKDLGISL